MTSEKFSPAEILSDPTTKVFPIKITNFGPLIYGFLNKDGNSLTIPTFYRHGSVLKKQLFNGNKKLILSEEDRFSVDNLCEILGLIETSREAHSFGTFLIGKYCSGPVTDFNEVGLLIRATGNKKHTVGQFAKLLNQELNLKVKPLTITELESLL